MLPTFLENNEVLEELNRMEKEVNPLFSLRQPFVLDVNRWAHRLQLVTTQRIDTFKINQLFSDSIAKTQPYRGKTSLLPLFVSSFHPLSRSNPRPLRTHKVTH